VITTVGLFADLSARIQPDDSGGDPDDRGYSIQRPVVIYDRVRESMRKYRTIRSAT